MSFFKVSKEEVEKAKQSMAVEFKDGDQPELLITEIKEITETDKEKVIIGCQVLNTEHKGKKFSMYISQKQTRLMIDFLSCFYSEQEIIDGMANPEDIVGKAFTCTVKVKEYQGKPFANYNKMRALSSVPDDLDITSAKEKSVEEAPSVF